MFKKCNINKNIVYENINKELIQPVWFAVLNGGNENDLQCKFSSNVPYHSHGNKTLIKKKFFIYKFSLPPLPMVIHWNEFYEENEMIEVGQALPSKQAGDFSTKITLIFYSHYHRLLPPTKQTVNVIKQQQETTLDSCI